METTEIMQAIERIEGKMAATSESDKAELKRLGEEQTNIARQLLELQQKGVKMQAPDREKSVGETFIESENFKAMAAGRASRARFDISEKSDLAPTAQNPITTPTGGVIQAYRRPGIMAGAFRPLTIESLFPTMPINTNAYEYVMEDEAQLVNGAAFVPEAGQKPFGSTGFTVKQGTIQTIAHMARVSKQLMADGPALVAYINQRLVYGIDLVVEDELVKGDGTTNHLHGILADGQYTPHGATVADLPAKSATLFDLILFAKTKIEAAFYRPSVVLMNPTDWSQMLMEKNASGDYYLGHPASVAPKTLWGLPVWTTPAIPAKKFLVGDFTQAATLWARQGMTVEMFEQDMDNVQKNLVTIRAERRLGFGVERPQALCGGDLALPAAASTGK